MESRTLDDFTHERKLIASTELYQDWILQWDQELRLRNRHILLLQDNFSAHVPPDNLTNITVENFEPNLTAHVQPNDAGIIRCFKAHYRARYIHRAIDRYENGIPPREIYDINQLEAMRLADIAWREVNASAIAHCWQKSGILPQPNPNPNPSNISIPIRSLVANNPTILDPVAQAEKDVEESLDSLRETGVLQAVNRMSIDSLLNPESERDLLEMVTEQDIFQAVMDAREAEENLVIAGGDDGQDDDADTLPRPSHRDALQAALLLQRYTQNMDDGYARNLEHILGSFGRATRLEEMKSLVDSSITDYLSKK
ncbi:hypothetical protein D9757_003734 [Collybiopsis confluens]|uniref:DDE-1 domain-containing protein n=1 Tax=Collybiopsis confluens TaxID=2823264 RepID=A0A8H5HVH2_9AGAR|nr:hypothetical protein D9757_003734 [Collybiopsis confluens]